MLSAFEKDVDLVSQRLTDIRAAILKYNSFIIGVAGISGVLIKYLLLIYTDDTTTELTTYGILTYTLVTITLLFEIIWYYVKTHNRHAGYVQLLNQECDYFNIKSIGHKNYFNLKVRSAYDFEPEKDLKGKILLTWEYIMSRYHSIFIKVSRETLQDRLNQIKFLLLPKNNFIFTSNIDMSKNIQNKFLLDVIFRQYGLYQNNISYDTKLKKLVLNFFWYKPKSLFYLYLNEYSEIRSKNIYKAAGWLYPIKMVQVMFIPTFIISGAFFYSLYHSSYEFTLNYEDYDWDIVILIFFNLIAIKQWLYRYIGGLEEIVYTKASTDYYCWAFFIFRVQYLNNHNILPTYYSRSFEKYYLILLISVVIYLFNRGDEVSEEILNGINLGGHFRSELNIRQIMQKFESTDTREEVQIQRIKRQIKTSLRNNEEKVKELFSKITRPSNSDYEIVLRFLDPT